MRVIDIKGEIINSNNQWIYDWLGMEATSPKKISDALRDAGGEDVEIHINSPGGDVFAGSEIYTLLRGYSGKVKIKILGIAASAASVIAQAGESEISPTGMFMIHNVKTWSSGDYRDMEYTAEALRAANESIINAYVAKTGMTQEELQGLMDRETYMAAAQAVEYGFIDKVMFTEQAPELRNGFGLLPEETLKKIKNLIKNPTPPEPDILMQKNKAAMKLKLLNLRGEK
nr:MAG TPA: Putative ATP dependent Clp protease [Caudoviricetes sp.]